MTRLRLAMPVALTLLLAGVAACGVPAETSARPLDPSAAPYRVVTRDRAAPPPGSHRVVLYLVQNGALVSVPRRILEQADPSHVLQVLNAGPTTAEKGEGLTTALPVDTDPQVTGVTGAAVTVKLPEPTENITRSDSVLAFGQMVLTLTALPTVNSVQFEQAGQMLQVPRADGSLSTEPLTRLDYRALVDPT